MVCDSERVWKFDWEFDWEFDWHVPSAMRLRCAVAKRPMFGVPSITNTLSIMIRNCFAGISLHLKLSNVMIIRCEGW